MISLVSPFFNIKEKYFIPFINSVLSQDFDDYELLLVDDGSTDDDSLKLLNTITDKHVHVIHKPHGGLSDTRNFGVKAISGDFLWIIDPDDEIPLGSLKKINEVFTRYPDVDLLVVGNNIRKESGKIVSGLIPAKGEFLPEDGFSSLCREGHIVNGYTWNKIYNIKRIGKENLPEFELKFTRYEDKIWNFKMMDIIKKGYAIQDICYIYNFNPAGLSRNKSGRRRLQDNSYESYSSILDYVEKKVSKTELYYEAMAFYYVSCFNDLSEWLFISKKKDPGREQHKQKLLTLHKELQGHKIKNKRYRWRRYFTRILLLFT